MDPLLTFVLPKHAQLCLQVQGKDIYKTILIIFFNTLNFYLSVEYTWSDSLSKKVKLPAPQYIDYMTTSIQNVLNDESIFPTKAGRIFCIIYYIFCNVGLINKK